MAIISYTTIFLLHLQLLLSTAAPDPQLDAKIKEMDQYFQSITTTNPHLSLTKLQIYLQAYFSSSTSHNQTIYAVAESPITSTSPTNFGRIIVLDNPATATPDIDSPIILGRYQGVNAYSDFEETALDMNMNMVFSAGEYGGSTVTIIGRQPANKAVRVLSVVGGTGKFRFGRGIALASTYSADPVTKSGTYLYVVYVVTPAGARVSPV